MPPGDRPFLMGSLSTFETALSYSSIYKVSMQTQETRLCWRVVQISPKGDRYLLKQRFATWGDARKCAEVCTKYIPECRFRLIEVKR